MVHDIFHRLFSTLSLKSLLIYGLTNDGKTRGNSRKAELQAMILTLSNM